MRGKGSLCFPLLSSALDLKEKKNYYLINRDEGGIMFKSAIYEK